MQALMKTKKGYGNVSISNMMEPECTAETVKIKIAFTGICGTDLHVLHDSFKNYPPVILGHEFSGIVSEIGENIKNIKVGDRVAVLGSTAVTCGTCSYCQSGNYMFCNDRRGMGHGVNGSFTEYVVAREDMVYKIPDHINLEVASLSEPLACAVQAIEELTNIQIGDTVLLSGPGPIGLLCLSLLVNKGCKVIVAGTSSDRIRFEIAKKLGADIIVDVENENLETIILEETNGFGVDVAVECAGASGSIQTCFESLKSLGKYIQVGIVGNKIKLDFDLILYKQLQVFGSLAHSKNTWDRVMQILHQDKINLSPIITHKLPLTEWKTAFQMCKDKSCGKILLYHE